MFEEKKETIPIDPARSSKILARMIESAMFSGGSLNMPRSYMPEETVGRMRSTYKRLAYEHDPDGVVRPGVMPEIIFEAVAVEIFYVVSELFGIVSNQSRSENDVNAALQGLDALIKRAEATAKKPTGEDDGQVFSNPSK